MRRRLKQSHEEILLDLLHERYGEVVLRTEILDALYPNDADRPASALTMVDAAVFRLRKAGHKIYCLPRQGFWVGQAPEPQPLARPTRPRPPKNRPLSPQTKATLTALIKRRGQIISPDALTDALYPAGTSRPKDALKRCYKTVCWLRGAGVSIETIHGKGFRLASVL